MSEFSKLTWLRQTRPLIRKLTVTQRDVLDVIFDHTNGEGKNAYPSQRQIADAIGKSDRQVRDILAQLRDSGLIVRTENGNKRLGHADKYELGSPEVAGDYRNPKSSGNELDYRNSDGGLPEVSPVITGSPALPSNRPLTSDPGPTDPDMSTGENSHEKREYEPDPWESVSSYPPSDSKPDVFDTGAGITQRRDAPDPFASLPSDGSSAQGGSVLSDEDQPATKQHHHIDPFDPANDPFDPANT